LTEFKKLIWMDADTLVLKVSLLQVKKSTFELVLQFPQNIDHLMYEPMLTGGITYGCSSAG
jgi:hypothetical protein